MIVIPDLIDALTVINNGESDHAYATDFFYKKMMKCILANESFAIELQDWGLKSKHMWFCWLPYEKAAPDMSSLKWVEWKNVVKKDRHIVI